MALFTGYVREDGIKYYLTCGSNPETVKFNSRALLCKIKRVDLVDCVIVCEDLCMGCESWGNLKRDSYILP